MEQETPRVSFNFTASKGGDIIFRSGDNVLFYLHKRNLEHSTGGFPSADSVKSTRTLEIVPLTETAATLEILFQFVYPQRHPSLDDMNWPTFSALAEAAEKYEVFNAMNTIFYRDYIPQYAAEIFGFAAKHDYPHVIAVVAPLLVGKPLDEVAETLPYYMYVPWSIYQQHWTKACSFAIGRALAFKACSTYTSHNEKLLRTASIMQRTLQDDPGRIARFSDLLNEIDKEEDKLGKFRKIECRICRISRQVANWTEEVEREVDNIPDFLSFLKRYRLAGQI
ncbi:hypothetical protein D9758_003579 [Tetrapyrgos nigripes]|uniref:BTB domain-containing protein n=1 Tax=Tetrapyrgos nigripes TaxID=182062 RepID=A0A8H5LW88_9AGAR|nr:hypothetical protein D9758_003579 [Tetrapyrgos nigripes]